MRIIYAQHKSIFYYSIPRAFNRFYGYFIIAIWNPLVGGVRHKNDEKSDLAGVRSYNFIPSKVDRIPFCGGLRIQLNPGTIFTDYTHQAAPHPLEKVKTINSTIFVKPIKLRSSSMPSCESGTPRNRHLGSHSGGRSAPSFANCINDTYYYFYLYLYLLLLAVSNPATHQRMARAYV